MPRLLPKSLLGQMLLAVALALLVAQALSAVLLYRAQAQRAENEIVNGLAFQLVVETRADRPGRLRGDRIRERVTAALQAPDIRRQFRDPAREAALREVLSAQGVPVAELVVLHRPANVEWPLASVPPRERLRVPQERDTGAVFAGLRRNAGEDWRIARVAGPRGTGRPLAGIILQTLILYAVLVGGLALLLKRLTRPLAALTARVEAFTGSPQTAGQPLEPSGPEDARRLIAAHNAMEARITALLDEKNVMLGAIGHDLKTPLAALRVRIESVEDEAERARMAATIEDITTTLDDILSLARVGRPSDPLERTDLAALVASVVEEYEDMGEDVELVDSTRIAMPLRATWLRRAMRNLVSNALRYGEQARVRLLREGDTAIIRIADTGPGIPDAELAQMLEPFARGEASRNRATGGAGLGLTLARAIAEQHGGTLVLANRMDQTGAVGGLVAEIRLPVAQSA
ncbi:sensor histidine kinase [Erythrobacter sp. EC-HK427]|uniref:sensor histidine kinase n=1 Tax=Erythrobacter sp. EC-HK427 TaxID=2038396 RepID=UPI001257CCBD|nr:ATP-binding protein [Erythrobacter sp. EC-HK427]VVT01895.1 Histidine kinase [Erythrobacter sp. EC-HK427]